MVIEKAFIRTERTFEWVDSAVLGLLVALIYACVTVVVFAELSSGVALTLENRGLGHVHFFPAFLRAGQADLGHGGAESPLCCLLACG